MAALRSWGGVGCRDSRDVMDMSRHMGGHSRLPMWLVVFHPLIPCQALGQAL